MVEIESGQMAAKEQNGPRIIICPSFSAIKINQLPMRDLPRGETTSTKEKTQSAGFRSRKQLSDTLRFDSVDTKKLNIKMDFQGTENNLYSSPHWAIFWVVRQ